MAKNHSLGVKSVKIAWSKNWARTKTRLFLRSTGQNLFRTVEKNWKSRTVWSQWSGKKYFFRQSLIIFPVLQKLTFHWQLARLLWIPQCGSGFCESFNMIRIGKKLKSFSNRSRCKNEIHSEMQVMGIYWIARKQKSMGFEIILCTISLFSKLMGGIKI